LANAANPTSDTNATTGASGVANWAVTSVSTSPTPQNGTHSLKWTHGGPDNTTYIGEINLGTALAAGATYSVTMYVNRVVGANFTVELDSGSGGVNGWTVDSSTLITTLTDPTPGVWREITLTGTRNGNSTSKILIIANSNADTGNAFAVDNIRIALIP